MKRCSVDGEQYFVSQRNWVPNGFFVCISRQAGRQAWRLARFRKIKKYIPIRTKIWQDFCKMLQFPVMVSSCSVSAMTPYFLFTILSR